MNPEAYWKRVDFADLLFFFGTLAVIVGAGSLFMPALLSLKEHEEPDAPQYIEFETEHFACVAIENGFRTSISLHCVQAN